MAEVIPDQNRQLEELSAAAAFRQIRARQAEEQLAVGEKTPEENSLEAVGSTESNDARPHGG